MIDRNTAAFGLIALLAAGAQAAAADGKTMTDRAGKCQATVPAQWVAGEFNIGMHDPGGQSSAIISSSSSADLTAAKAVASSTFTVQRTIEDTSSRYWIAYADRLGKPLTHWYIAVLAGGASCAMQLDFDSHLSDAEAKAIAVSLKKH